MRYKAKLLSLRFPGIKVLIVRRTFAELTNNHINPLLKELNGIAKYNKTEKDKIKTAKYESKRRELFKQWVRGRSCYMFWARCEWEMLLANWPFGSYRLRNEMKEFLKNPVNSFAIGTWIAGVSVLCNVFLKYFQMPPRYSP